VKTFVDRFVVGIKYKIRYTITAIYELADVKIENEIQGNEIWMAETADAVKTFAVSEYGRNPLHYNCII